MAKLIKQIYLFAEATATRAATTYAVPTNRPRFLYTSANWSATTVSIYFEAVFKTSSGTGYAQLYTTGGSAVSGSEVSTTSTGITRVRSSAISLTNATEYEVRIKSSSASDTVTLYNANLVFVLDGTINAFETHIALNGGLSNSTGTSYLDSVNFSLANYTSANWDGTTNIYFEATMLHTVATNTIYAQVYTEGNTAVTGSEISLTSTTITRVRSGAITLTDATNYKVKQKTTASTGRVYDARLIFVQSGATKTENHTMIKPVLTATTSITNVDINGRAYWDNDEYSVTTKTDYFEGGIAISNALGTATLILNDGSSDIVSITRTGSNARVLTRSASITPSDDTTYSAFLKTNNASYTARCATARIVSVITFTNPSGFIPRIIFI